MGKFKKKNQQKEIKKINVRNLFMDLQTKMIASLSISSKNINHPTSKGDAAEFDWKKWLTDYLPERYKVEKAFIIDLNGQISDEIDLVVFDRNYSPFLLNHSNSLYIPVESVYAAFEVKQILDKQNFDYAAKKAFSIRHLYRTSGKITCLDGLKRRQQLKHILFGVLSTSSSWKYPIKEKLEKLTRKLQENARIDIGCSIMNGSFSITYENETPKIVESHKEDALLFFYFNLFDRLQQYGNPPALDINEYMKVMKIQR